MVLNFIHIGKCGGTSLGNALSYQRSVSNNMTDYKAAIEESNKIATTAIEESRASGNPNLSSHVSMVQHIPVMYYHCNTPDYVSTDKYVICLRNPVDRFVSAFNWIHLRVTSTYNANIGRNHMRYIENNISEYEFSLYDNDVNIFAESLYDCDGNLNSEVDHIIRRVGKHRNYPSQLGLDIDFYLRDLIWCCKPENIEGIISFPTIRQDAHRIFGIEIDHHKKSFGNTKLSSKGYANLVKYLKKDYECIEKLYEMGAMTVEQYSDLKKSNSYDSLK